MGKKLSTLTTGVVAAAVSAVAMAPSAFAYIGQNNKVTPIFDSTDGNEVDVAINHHKLEATTPGIATLTIKPAEDYACKSVAASYKYKGSTRYIEGVSCEETTFELPAFLSFTPVYPDVNVNVNFARKVYAINIDVAEEGTGTAEANATESISGKTITLTATPAENYQFVEWTGDMEVSADAITTFTMPKSEVNLTAVFEKYAIIEGAESSWTVGSEEGLTITGNGYFTDFVAAYVDDNELGKANYTAEAGSTKVTLNPAFLATLANGSHTFSMEWENGSAETTFAIVTETPEPTPEPTPEEEEEEEEEVKEEKKVAPDTGVTSAVAFAGIAAALTLGGAIVALKSKFNA